MFTRFAFLVIAVVVGLGALVFSQVTRGRLVEATSVVTAPAQSIVDAPLGAVEGFFRGLGDVSQVMQENEALRAEADRLRQQVVRLSELEHENEVLRQQANYRGSQPDLQLLSARIIGYDTNPLVDAVIIDQGLSSGVADGMVVVAPGGLVGRIERAGPSSSKVMLLTAAASAANCVVQGSRARGVAEGTSTGSLLMRYVNLNETVSVGDQVVTSGLGGLFPPGLLIGKVAEVRRKDADLVQEIVLTPAVDLRRLESVLVITSFRPDRLD